MEKIENVNVKLQQEYINLERENQELKKNDKQLRKDYLLRYQELEKQNLKLLRQKNRVIETQRKRSISQTKKN